VQTLSIFFGGITAFVIILARYFLFAGLAYWWLYGRGDASQASDGPAAMRRRPPSLTAIRTDIRLSVQSAAVFAVAMAGVLQLQAHGLTRLYSSPNQNGWWYLGVSYVLVLILQDGFFYATHRLAHQPALFSWLHRGHHRSGQPTPWTSFAFDPPEAALQALFLVLLVVILPLHLFTLLAVMTTMTIWAIVTHLGLSQRPAGGLPQWLGRWLIGPAHHGIHHRHSNRHFGLYFTFWDWLLATDDPGDDKPWQISAGVAGLEPPASPSGTPLQAVGMGPWLPNRPPPGFPPTESPSAATAPAAAGAAPAPLGPGPRPPSPEAPPP